jgi:beta-lactam-binding protein with PASTA domain
MRFLRWLLRALIIVLVGLASMLTAMRFAIHGREVSIPKLAGMTVAQAEQVANNNGLLLARDDRFYSSTVPEGRIISQVPIEGTRVRRGWRIRVAESIGPQRVTIPDVVGQSNRAAELNLRRRGLNVGSVASIAVSGVPAEQVLAQSPPANAQGISAPKVNLLLSAPEQVEEAWVMPDFAGAKLADATAAVTQTGLKMGRVRFAPDPSQPAPANGSKQPAPKPTPDSVVVHQTPAPGQKVVKETTVSFDVAHAAQ